MSKVSVIIPNYNHSAYLKQRIDSVISQTFEDFEIIILDDCSTDGSNDIIESYRQNPKVSNIDYNEVNSGSPFHQWIKGINLACGEWIWIAESDDWVDAVFLEYMLTCAEKYPECGLVYSLPEPSKDNQCLMYDGAYFIRKKLIYGNVITNASGVLFRRDLFLSTQYRRIERMRLCGDWMSYVMMAEKTSVLFCPEAHSHYRRYVANSSRESKKEGLPFIEGIDVLEYIYRRYNFPKLWALARWGNYMASSSLIYKYEDDVEGSVINLYKHRFALIVLFYHLFRVRWKVHFALHS